MFDLERAIATWRQQMQASGIKSSTVLDELESHLREDIEQHLRAGANEERAFEMAVQNVGQAIELNSEFMKAENIKWTILRRLKHFLGLRDVPLPTLEHWEPEARQTLQLAPEEARHFNHDFIGTEHILLGLMRSGSRSLSNVMQKLGLNCDTVRMEIEKIVGNGLAANASATIPYTPRAKQALKLAADEANKLNERHVRAEHIFLGLLREGSGVAAMVLTHLHVQLDRARAEVLQEMKARPQTN